MIKIAIEKKWFVCPDCGKKLVVYDDTAKCRGVYVYCKFCKKEVEIKVNCS